MLKNTEEAEEKLGKLLEEEKKAEKEAEVRAQERAQLTKMILSRQYRAQTSPH
jgi:hypothetical protein